MHVLNSMSSQDVTTDTYAGAEFPLSGRPRVVILADDLSRTSVDPVGAFDIAGQDETDARNMKAVMSLALRMVLGRRQRTACGVR